MRAEQNDILQFVFTYKTLGAKKCHIINDLLTSTARMKRVNARKNNTWNNYLLTQSEVMPGNIRLRHYNVFTEV